MKLALIFVINLLKFHIGILLQPAACNSYVRQYGTGIGFLLSDLCLKQTIYFASPEVYEYSLVCVFSVVFYGLVCNFCYFDLLLTLDKRSRAFISI